MVDFLVNVRVDPSGAVVGTRQVERSLDRVNNRADQLRATLARAFAVIGVGVAVRNLARIADEYTTLQNRLRTVIEDQNQLNDTYNELTQIANRTRTSVGAIAQLYQRGSISARELGASQEDLLLFTERVGVALGVQGGAAAEASGALRQLSQSLGSGIVRAEEFNSILEGATPIARAAAAGIERAGGSVSRLRQLVVEGQITSREFFEGFLRGSEDLEAAFSRTTPTISQAFTVLRNNLIQFVGEADSAARISERFARAIIFVGENLEQFARIAAFVGITVATALVQRGILSLVAALRTLSVALLTNPLFAIGALIATSVAAVIAFGDQITVASDGIANLQDVVFAAFNAINQIVGPILDALGDSLASVFGGQLPTLRELAEAFALTFDQIVGVVRGSVLVVNDLLTTQLGAVFQGTVSAVSAFGLRVQLTFEQIANGLVNLFIDPVNTILRAIQTLVSSIAGAAAVAAQLGVISESSRLEVEDTIAGVEAAIARLESGRDPIKIFDTDDTRRDIAALEDDAANSFSNVGSTLKDSFLEGFEQDTILGFVSSIFNEAEANAQAREAERARREAARANETRAGRATVGGPFAGDVPPELSDTAQKILERVDAQARLNEQTVAFNELLGQREDLSADLESAFLAAQIAALEASTAAEDGFSRAFLKIQQEAQDLASVAESAVQSFADRATDAITEFLLTGEGGFKEFANAILADLTRILVRLLVVQAISAALGVAGGGGGGIANAAAGLASGAAAGGGGGRARGGTVQPDRSFVVGEEGPELFVPGRTGTIVPNAASVESEPPQVNVQVVNVDDENAVPSAIEDGRSDEAILNVLARNKSRVSQVIR